jgi:hypothetical protein
MGNALAGVLVARYHDSPDVAALATASFTFFMMGVWSIYDHKTEKGKDDE